MPGKHVRFAHADIVHYPPTAALSTSSLPATSSHGPLTPQSANAFPSPQSSTFPGPTPYAMPFPPSPKHVRPHILLQLSNSPLLNFDLRQPPLTITSHQQGIQLRALSEPATQPSLAALTIIIPRLPWSVVVYPSHRRAFVTVKDALEELYNMLRTNISAEEFHSLPSDKDQRRVTAAYEQRYRRIRGSREHEDDRGVKRVDFLMGQTKFMGISPSATRPDVWVLHFA